MIEQGIIKKVSKKYEYQFNAPELNTAKFDELRNAKLKDLDSMLDYVFTNKPRMKFLCEYLGDTLPNKFENCDNSKYKKRTVSPRKETIDKLVKFRETYFPVLNIESNNSNIENGIASSYYGVSNVGITLHRCKYENGGDFPDFLLKLTLKAFRKTFGNKQLDLIVYVPPTSSGELVKNFAEKISYVLKIPISHKLVKQRETQQQKIFQNGYLKRENVSGAFNYTEPNEINNKSILLVDDIFDSGATIKEIGKILTNFGAKTIVPLVIARTVGGDI